VAGEQAGWWHSGCDSDQTGVTVSAQTRSASSGGGRSSGGARYLRLVGIGLLIGVPAAFAAALFLALVHDLEQWLWTDLPHALGAQTPPWYLVLCLPLVGAAVVVVARRFLPGDGGHEPLRGLDPTPTPVRNAPGVLLAALGTLSFGAVLGPEMPIIAVGSIVGLAVTERIRLRDQEQRMMASAGEFSAISALFGGPIVAGMLLVESGVGLGVKLLPALLPGLVAAGIGYTIFIGFGSWGGLDAPGLAVPNLPAYHGLHAGALLLGVVIGVLTAVVIAVVHRLGRRVVSLRDRLGMPFLLLAGGLVTGALAELAELLGANSQDVLFSGQTAIPVLAAVNSTKVLVILLVAKTIAYVVCLGCGFRGGPIFPALFVGIGLASFGELWFNASPTLVVAVGAAAALAAQTKLLMSPLVLALLLVGVAGENAMPAAVFASAAAWLTIHMLEREKSEEQPREAQPAAGRRAAG